MNQGLILYFRALCRTEKFKALRPVNLEKAVYVLQMGRKKNI
jgi:hypothetical protein